MQPACVTADTRVCPVTSNSLPAFQIRVFMAPVLKMLRILSVFVVTATQVRYVTARKTFVLQVRVKMDGALK